MQRVYSSLNLFMVENAHNLLELQGIGTVVKNRDLTSASGELPPLSCEPELWIVDDADLEAATKILEEAGYGRNLPPEGPDWICDHCREANPDSFALCWQCGTGRRNP